MVREISFFSGQKSRERSITGESAVKAQRRRKRQLHPVTRLGKHYERVGRRAVKCCLLVTGGFYISQQLG